MNRTRTFLRLAAMLLAATLSLFCVACNATDHQETEAPTEAATVDVLTMAEVKAEIDSKETTDFTETDEITEYVKITVKDHGDIVLRLRADVAPITVDNFQKLVSESFYDGVTFHRIYKGFMIQGGDPDGDGMSDPNGPSIKGEFSSNGVPNHLKHIRGVISMARTNAPNSAYSQFFICDADSAFLDGGYAAFGYVVAGLETVDSVASVRVQNNGFGEISDPVGDVIMEKVCFVIPN